MADLPRLRLAVPGEDGQANVGIGVGMGTRRRAASLRADLARFCALLRQRGDLTPGAQHGAVTGGWLRMGGTGTPPAAGNVLLVGDAAGLINPLQGEGIGPAMVSARLAAEACWPGGPGAAAARTPRRCADTFGRYMPGAAALQAALLRRPRLASGAVRLLTAPGVRRLVAGTWSLYWNGLVDGASPRPAAWAGRGGAAGGFAAGQALARGPPAGRGTRRAGRGRARRAGSRAGRSGAGRDQAGRDQAGRSRAGRTPAGCRRCRNSPRAGDARRARS